jgi:hypothetical protein
VGQLFSRLPKICVSAIFTCPENLGECCFHVSRKSGQVLFSVVPKIWASAVFTCPENLGVCYFHVSRKSGRVLFSLVPKIWACAIFTLFPKIWAYRSTIFTIVPKICVSVWLQGKIICVYACPRRIYCKNNVIAAGIHAIFFSNGSDLVALASMRNTLP